MNVNVSFPIALIGLLLVCGCLGDRSQLEKPFLPEGGLAVGISPRNISISPGGSADIQIEVYNNENINDTVRVYLDVGDLPADYQSDLSWFNWTDLTVETKSGEMVALPLGVSVPGDVTGLRLFRVRVESVVWRPKAFTTGVLRVG